MIHRPRRRCASLLAGLTALLLTAVTACIGSSDDGRGRNISISVVAGWDEDVAVSNLWTSLLEERGYTVNLHELDIASTFTGVANGQVDLYMDAWLPTHQAYWDRSEDRLEVVSTWQEGRNTVVVPDYVTDVNTVADLKGKAARFGGRIVGIEAGAGEMEAMREKVVPGYGLTDFTLVEGSAVAMLASLDSAIEQKQPIVVTLWQPHWAFSRFPLKVLDDPQTAFGPPDEIQMIATKGWSAANPEAAAWLKNFTITPAQLSDLMLTIQSAGKGQEQAAATQWAADNRSVVDTWFAAPTG